MLLATACHLRRYSGLVSLSLAGFASVRLKLSGVCWARTRPSQAQVSRRGSRRAEVERSTRRRRRRKRKRDATACAGLAFQMSEDRARPTKQLRKRWIHRVRAGLRDV